MATEWLPVAAVAFVGALAGIGLVVRLVRRRSADRPDLVRRANRALENALPPGVGTHLESRVTVRHVATSGRPDGDRVVPVVRVPLGTTDAPRLDLVFEYVASVVAALHPVFGDRVARYDVEFAFGPDGPVVSSRCARVSIPPALADRLVDDPTYRAHELRRDATDGELEGEREDEGGAEEAGEKSNASVVWGDCLSYR